MRLLCQLLCVGGLVLAGTVTASAQSPYYPPMQGSGVHHPHTCGSAAPFVSNRPYSDGLNAPAWQEPFHPVRQTAYYPAGHSPNFAGQRTAYFAPAAPSIAIATPVVPSTTRVRSGTVVGRGILGQPKAYVQGEPLRNAVRFLTP